MKDPFIKVTLSALKKTLQNDTNKRLLRSYLEGKVSEEQIALKLFEWMASRASIPPEDYINIKVKNNREKRHILKNAGGVSNLDVETFNKELVEARVRWLGHNRAFIPRIQPNSVAYRQTVELVNILNELYFNLGFSKLGTHRKEFYKTYLDVSLPSFKNSKNFNISFLIDSNCLDRSMRAMERAYECLTDDRPDRLTYLINLFIQKTGRKQDVFSSDYDRRHKFYKTVRMIEEAMTVNTEEAFKKVADKWVQAQVDAFESHFSGVKDTKTELGYLCGAEAANRFTDFLASSRAVNPVKITRKISKGW